MGLSIQRWAVGCPPWRCEYRPRRPFHRWIRCRSRPRVQDGGRGIFLYFLLFSIILFSHDPLEKQPPPICPFPSLPIWPLRRAESLNGGEGSYNREMGVIQADWCHSCGMSIGSGKQQCPPWLGIRPGLRVGRLVGEGLPTGRTSAGGREREGGLDQGRVFARGRKRRTRKNGGKGGQSLRPCDAPRTVIRRGWSQGTNPLPSPEPRRGGLPEFQKSRRSGSS